MSGREDDAGPKSPPPSPTTGEGETTPAVEEGEADLIGVGDNREKRVTVLERSGNRSEHAGVYVRHATDEFVLSPDRSFPPATTTRFSKRDLLRVEISQHHSMCFITTATVGEGDSLDVLRSFRDDALRRTVPGRVLVGVYYRVSPPVARTLRAYPNGRTTRLVRWLVERSAALARYRVASDDSLVRFVLALVLMAVYVLGLGCAIAGHLLISFRTELAERAIGSVV